MGEPIAIAGHLGIRVRARSAGHLLADGPHSPLLLTIICNLVSVCHADLARDSGYPELIGEADMSLYEYPLVGDVDPATNAAQQQAPAPNCATDATQMNPQSPIYISSDDEGPPSMASESHRSDQNTDYYVAQTESQVSRCLDHL